MKPIVATRPQPTDAGDAPAFTLTAAQLSALVARDLVKALAGEPLLVDKHSIAQKVGCSATHIDSLRKRGLPVVYVGELVRFDPLAVVEWLKKQTCSNESE